MKILFVNHTASLTGAPISCINIIANLENDFIPVFASSENGPIVEELNKLGIKSYIVAEKGILGFRYIARFLNIIKSEKIDLIHLNTLTPFCKYAGIAGFLKRIPIVWAVRENPLISRSRRLRFWLKRLSSKIIFVDKDTKEKLLDKEMSDKADVIYNGVALDRFKPFKSDFLFKTLNINPDEKLAGYIGLITKRKGIEYLIKAIPLIKKTYNEKFKVIIIGWHKSGDEAYFLEIKGLIKELSLEKDIYFTGMLSDVRDALNSLDIVVLPSLEERCSRTLLESLACAKPVAATNVGGTPEIIDNNINGILVEPENEKELADAVSRLLSDDGLRQKMGMNGRIKAEKLFDIKGNMQKIKNIYLQVG